MGYKRKIIYLLFVFILYKMISGVFLFDRGFYDIFIPLLPFIALIKSVRMIIGAYSIIGVTSSLIHYDELFCNMLGYGISILLLINFSKKYSLLNIFNYTVSIIAISLLNFSVLLLAYLVKDKVVAFGEIYRYVFLNLFVGIFYYLSYRIITFEVAGIVKR